MSSETMTIEKGSIYAYRIFDIGNELNLENARKILEQQGEVKPFHLNKISRSLLINVHPIVLTMPSWTEKILDDEFTVQCSVKLWSFGTLSMKIQLELGKSYTFDDLCLISHHLENNETFHQEAVKKAQVLIDLLKSEIEKPGLWDQYEDYLIFNITKVNGLKNDIREAFVGSKLTALILGEKPMDFSEQVNKALSKNIHQYGKNDLVLVHWNGAVIYDQVQVDVEKIAYTLEFALCQLLELRYYDYLLDEQLTLLYQQIEQKKSGIFINPYRDLSKKAALEYIDISEIVDRVSNASKIIGDFYLASIYKSATEEFHIPDWRKNVSHKLGNLAEIAKLFHGEINEKRNQIMEFIIIVLIAIEVFPYLYGLFDK